MTGSNVWLLKHLAQCSQPPLYQQKWGTQSSKMCVFGGLSVQSRNKVGLQEGEGWGAGRGFHRALGGVDRTRKEVLLSARPSARDLHAQFIKFPPSPRMRSYDLHFTGEEGSLASGNFHSHDQGVTVGLGNNPALWEPSP